MATEDKKLNLNEITWATRDTGFVPGDGEMWWYDNSGTKIFVIGDGSTTLANLVLFTPKKITKVLTNTTINSIAPNVTGWKISDDIVNLCVFWPDIPYSGTSVALTYAGGATLRIYDGTGTTTALGSYTESNLAISGQLVSFYINQTGICTSMNYGPLGLYTSGASWTMTLS